MCLNLEGSKKSDFIGQLYFNILKLPCFTLKKGYKCLSKTWWGKCLKVTEALIGKWHESLKYN